VTRAVADAKAGDSTARGWLTKQLLGDKRPALLDLAAGEQLGLSGDEQVREAAVRQDQPGSTV